MTKLENEELEPSGLAMLRIAHVLERPVGDIFKLREVPSGKANFQPISRRASVRAGESNNMAEQQQITSRKKYDCNV
jgi:hypothetical protein